MFFVFRGRNLTHVLVRDRECVCLGGKLGTIESLLHGAKGHVATIRHSSGGNSAGQCGLCAREGLLDWLLLPS